MLSLVYRYHVSSYPGPQAVLLPVAGSLVASSLGIVMPLYFAEEGLLPPLFLVHAPPYFLVRHTVICSETLLCGSFPLFCIQPFLLVCLLYAAFGTTTRHNQPVERHRLLTVLFDPNKALLIPCCHTLLMRRPPSLQNLLGSSGMLCWPEASHSARILTSMLRQPGICKLSLRRRASGSPLIPVDDALGVSV